MSKLRVSDTPTMPENFRISVQIFEALSLDVPLRAEDKMSSGWCPHSGTIYGSQFWNSYLVSLHRDPFCVDKYYVAHATGVHCVKVDSLRQFKDFVAASGENRVLKGP